MNWAGGLGVFQCIVVWVFGSSSRQVARPLLSLSLGGLRLLWDAGGIGQLLRQVGAAWLCKMSVSTPRLFGVVQVGVTPSTAAPYGFANRAMATTTTTTTMTLTTLTSIDIYYVLLITYYIPLALAPTTTIANYYLCNDDYTTGRR